MNLTNVIVDISSIISAFLAIYCTVPYILSILNGKTKPHQFSWVIFAIMNGIITLSQFLEGARLSVIVPAIFFIVNLITVALAFKYGVRDTSIYDRLLFMFCLVIIAIWALTKNNALAIWLTVAIDIQATTMMILKVKAKPDSEAIFPWAMGSLAYVFSCLTLLNRPFGVLYVRPIYGLLSDFAMVAAIYYFLRPSTRISKSMNSPSRN
jgi:hypothetical protein